MALYMIVYAGMVLLALATTAIFRRQVVHVYNVGHEDAIKSLGVGIAVCFALIILTKLGEASLSENKWLIVMYLFVLPALIFGFTAGCPLIAGLAGFNGAENRFLSILVVGGAACFATFFIPVGGGFIDAGISAYGVGASILALQVPMPDEVSAPAAVSEDPASGSRSSLGGDLSPLPRPGSEKDAE